MGSFPCNKQQKIEKNQKSNIDLLKSFSLYKDIREDYVFGVIIGSGSFGDVRICKKKDLSSNKLFTVKSIYKLDLKESHLNTLMNEVRILSKLDHPNIVKLYETYQDSKFLHLVMEYCDGGDLFEKIRDYKKINEYDILIIIWNLLLAVSYCHKKGIVHRDIKPENILFDSNDNQYDSLKLIDFGLSSKFSNKKMSSFKGTLYYMAPEVFKGNYNNKCDIWSVGVITYLLCSGSLPYNHIKSIGSKEEYEKVFNKGIEFNDICWRSISNKCKSFIKRVLTKKISSRPSVEKALEDEWFKQINLIKNKEFEVCNKALVNLKKFTYDSLFKKEIIKMILKNFLSNDEIRRLRNIFKVLDLDNTGYININELAEGYKKCNMSITDDELKKIINTCDDAKNGKIDYSEFLVGGLDSYKYINRKNLDKVFICFDFDCDGVVSYMDLFQYYKLTGNDKSEEQVKEIIKSECLLGKEFIDKERFYSMFHL